MRWGENDKLPGVFCSLWWGPGGRDTESGHIWEGEAAPSDLPPRTPGPAAGYENLLDLSTGLRLGETIFQLIGQILPQPSARLDLFSRVWSFLDNIEMKVPDKIQTCQLFINLYQDVSPSLLTNKHWRSCSPWSQWDWGDWRDRLRRWWRWRPAWPSQWGRERRWWDRSRRCRTFSPPGEVGASPLSWDWADLELSLRETHSYLSIIMSVGVFVDERN